MREPPLPSMRRRCGTSKLESGIFLDVRAILDSKITKEGFLSERVRCRHRALVGGVVGWSITVVEQKR
ncbi:unnamed protein product [Leptosia nina]|uniref:Uncharacterized protein n=1 Tax=Leptosia nina TaxID=320188 RepID=A0AAV1J1Q6_9NEOP